MNRRIEFGFAMRELTFSYHIPSNAVHDISKLSTQSYSTHCMTFPQSLFWQSYVMPIEWISRRHEISWMGKS